MFALRFHSSLAASSLLLLTFGLLGCGGYGDHSDGTYYPGPPRPPVFPDAGNILIADQFNNRVIEVDAAKNIVWQFGDGPSTAGPSAIVAPNDAERLDPEFTLICGTGAPAGSEPTCPDGCPDHRVVVVDRHGNIVWQYGKTGVAGSGPNQLNTPVCAVYLPSGHILITDQGNHRVIEVNQRNLVLWQYGTTGVAGAGDNQLSDPNSAELLDNGHVLIADEGNNRVLEVTADHTIAWHYGDPADTSLLSGPAFASRLASGNTLISDASNNRVLEVDPSGAVVFNFDCTSRPGSVAQPLPARAVRLKNGDTLISDQFNHQVIEIDPTKQVVWSFGTLGTAGAGTTLLNAPYDAKAIGDFAGLTLPWYTWTP